MAKRVAGPVQNKRGRPKAVSRRSRPFTPRRANYTEEDMAEAVRLVKEEDYSIQRAAKTTNRYKLNSVPRMTLANRLKLKDPYVKVALGRPQELSQEVEEALVKVLVKCGEYNYPLRKKDLQDIVQAYVTEHEVCTRWPAGRPAKDWCRYFLKRHKASLKLRKPTNIKRSRGKVGPHTVKEFFENLAPNLDGISPDCVFNYDETNLRHC